MIEPSTSWASFQHNITLIEVHTHQEPEEPQLLYPQQWQSNLQVRTRELNDY